MDDYCVTAVRRRHFDAFYLLADPSNCLSLTCYCTVWYVSSMKIFPVGGNGGSVGGDGMCGAEGSLQGSMDPLKNFAEPDLLWCPTQGVKDFSRTTGQLSVHNKPENPSSHSQYAHNCEFLSHESFSLYFRIASSGFSMSTASCMNLLR